METEVTSNKNDESTNSLKNNPKAISVQSVNNKASTNIETSELLMGNNHNESSSETYLIQIKETTTTNNNNNKESSSSGASPKLLLDVKQTTNSIPKKSESTGNDSIIDSGCQYFFEDEVFRIDKKGRVKFGLVVETPATNSADDDDFDELLGKGEMFIVWYPENKETLESENSVGLVDRTLMPGDVVKRLVPGKETQTGYCRDINMKADVKVLGTKYIIKNVNAERLRVISNWQCDAAVCLDSWVGSVRKVEMKAVLRTATGCRIEISSNDFNNFKDLNSRPQRHTCHQKLFYPGSTVIGSLPSMENVKILTPDIPLHMNKKGKPLNRKFVVESLYTDCVWVNWQCKALSDDTNLEDITIQPNPCVTGEDFKRLKRLNLFESCMLQIGDRNYLTYSACDTLVAKSEWDKEQSIKFKQIFPQQKEENLKIIERTSVTESTVTADSHHHHEKVKKKHSLDDKSVSKLKKVLHKGDKISKRGETAQETTSNEKRDTAKSKEDAEWFSTDDDDVDEDNCGINSMDINNFVENIKQFIEDCKSTTTTLSTCSSPSPHMSPKHLTKLQIRKKTRKNFKKPFLKEDCNDFNPKECDELITEALVVYSTATVVWQDGTIEENIPSTQLYPIHHLDNHEFFPGDFVVSGKEDDDFNNLDYGVIQTVDHKGRTAHVKWFTTYTSIDDPRPTYKGESECSVYDLKDEPDFQYRPGTMVIRVANFVGEEAKCTAGQVIDNYIDGRVKVWWVDGHISMCWPQDLYEVGQMDQGDLSNASDDSWETESENSELGCIGSSSLKLAIAESHILSNIDRARVAIARLEEIFNISPNLQNPEVMRQLLTIYIGCRYLDSLLNTNFFHEDNFMGLIKRVGKDGSQTVHERVQVQKNRLFNDKVSTTNSSSSNKQQQHYMSLVVRVAGTGNSVSAIAGNSFGFSKTNENSSQLSLSQQSESLPGLTASKEFAPRILFTISSTPFKFPNSHNHTNQLTTLSSSKRHSSNTSVAAAQENQAKKTEEVSITKENDKFLTDVNEAITKKISSTSIANNVSLDLEISPNKQKQYNEEKKQLLNSVMMNIEEAFEKTSHLAASSHEDSGNRSRSQNCDMTTNSYESSSDLTNVEANKVDENKKSCSSIALRDDAAPEFACVRLCSLLKEQLDKCRNEIYDKYYKDDQLHLCDIVEVDVVNNDEEILETVLNYKENKEDNKNVLNIIQNEETDDIKDSSESSITKQNNTILTQASMDSLEKEYSLLATSDVTIRTNMESDVNRECFQVLSSAPKNHMFYLTIFHPNHAQQYYKAVQREHRMLKTSLPPGVYVKAYEDRMDLLSVMIEGPKHTPYEEGMFFFDIQLGCEYPKSPPLCHYISYCSDRLNPNLYENGKVCVSLLGTWMGKDTEVWNSKSTILQVIVSIQGLILVSEPYFNEAGYDKQKGTQQGKENSRMYNEMVVIKLVQATTKLLKNIPEVFRDEVLSHFKQNGLKMYDRIKSWMELSKEFNDNKNNNQDFNKNAKQLLPNEQKYNLPAFSLIPASRGFCLTLAGLLDNFKQKLVSLTEIGTSTTSCTTSTLENIHD